MSRTFQEGPTQRFAAAVSPAGRGLAGTAGFVALLANILDIRVESRLAAAPARPRRDAHTCSESPYRKQCQGGSSTLLYALLLLVEIDVSVLAHGAHQITLVDALTDGSETPVGKCTIVVDL